MLFRSFIGFRDKKDKEQIEFKDFETDPVKLVEYIKNNFECKGGGDTCEDLVTPLKKALEINWRSDLVYVYLIIDAPAHGMSYHKPQYSDDYPDDDKDQLLEKLISHYKKSRINLVIVKCTNICDMMIEKIRRNYESSINKLTVIELLHEDELKKDFAKNFLENMTKNISESMRNSRFNNFHKIQPKAQAAIPVFNTTKMLFEKKFKGKIHTASINGLIYEELKYNYTLELSESNEFEFKVSSARIGAGLFSECYKMTVDGDEGYVAKIRKEIISDINDLKPDVEGNAFVIYFAEKFNYYLKVKEKEIARFSSEIYKEKLIRVLPVVIMENIETDKFKKAIFFLAQKLMNGEYIKFNNNYGWVNKDQMGTPGFMAQAFSHFTYEYSMGTMIITDIQGIVNEDGGLSITDPAIHSMFYKGKFGLTNHGKVGIMRFFSTHNCNEICKKLKLADPKKILEDKLANVRALHKGYEALNHLYGSFEDQFKEYQNQIKNFDPSKPLELEVIEEEPSCDGKATESGSKE